MSRLNGGTLLAKSLAALGVTEAFALHGGHMDALLVACADEGIRLTDTRHEATAGYAAEAYARATQQIGVAVITAGPGFTNGLTALADAFLDAAPILVISGSPPLREAETNPLQGGFDLVAMATPVTKWAHRITNVERIPDLVDKAVRIALSGRPGPVFLEVPIDIMFGPLAGDMPPLPATPTLASRPAPTADAVDYILELIAGSQRPAIIAGGGAASPRCAELLTRLAERTGVPVVLSGKANGVLPTDHPLNLGSAGVLAETAVGVQQQADLIIQLGARAGLFLGGRSGIIIPDAAKLVQIDLDASEIGRLRAPDVAIVADAGETIKALLDAIGEREFPSFEPWVGLLGQVRAAGQMAFAEAPHETEAGLIHPFHAARAIVEALSPDTAIATDGGESSSWFNMLGRSAGPGLYQGTGYLGTLGIGQGFAIGLARAAEDRPVAAIMGDGAVGFHIAEFDTMARHNLPILTIIFNNAAWGMSLHGQELVFGANRTAAVHLAHSAYHQVAQGLGCAGEEIRKVEDIGPAIRRAQDSGKPTCLNILTDPAVAHPITEAMIGELDNPNEIAIPYYENIPLHK